MELVRRAGLLALLCVLAAGAVGCNVSDRIVPASQAGHRTEPGPQGRETSKKKPRTTPVLQDVVDVFLQNNGDEWKSYDRLRGVQWNDKTATEYVAGRFSRSGVMLLEGFSDKPVPDGKVGFEAGVVQENEGRSGVTLDGDATRVTSFAVKKFYPETDYIPVLRRQFVSPSVKIVGLARTCDPDPNEVTLDDAFFRIEMDGRHVFVNAYGEDGGKSGPGYTVFDFTREEPRTRMKELNCK